MTLTRLKIAVFTPMPRARTATAAMVKLGDFQSCRNAKRRSFIIIRGQEVGGRRSDLVLAPKQSLGTRGDRVAAEFSSRHTSHVTFFIPPLMLAWDRSASPAERGQNRP